MRNAHNTFSFGYFDIFISDSGTKDVIQCSLKECFRIKFIEDIACSAKNANAQTYTMFKFINIIF